MGCYFYLAIVHFILTILIHQTSSYNILVIFGHPGKSHYDVFKPLFKELGERGHQLTIIGHTSSKDDIENSRDIIISDEPVTHILNVTQFDGSLMQKFGEAAYVALFGSIFTEKSLRTKALQDFIKEDNQFDVILTEFFNSNSFFALITKFNAPFIGLSSCSMLPWHAGWFGSAENPSYVPSLYSAHQPPMTFLQRLENTIIHLTHKTVYKLLIERPGIELAKKYIGYEPADTRDASLLLLNTHHTLHGSIPLTPNIIEVGGIHVSNKKAKRLPQKLEKFTNESSAGLIYFSFGSLLKGHTFPKDKLQLFFKVFAKLPQKVIWKWENDLMENKPDNILLSEWTPQFDILCHPNTVLFISHGGLLGTTEAVHCGVPVLVLPQFGDQKLNAGALQRQGGGIALPFQQLTEKQLEETLHKLLTPSFRRQAKELSQRFRDRLVSPLETSVYWVEHVAKYKGARYMRSAAVDMPFYQYFLLDVIAFLIIFVLGFIFIFYKVLRFVLRKLINRTIKIKTT